MFKYEIKGIPVAFTASGGAIRRAEKRSGRPKVIVIEASTYVTVDQRGARRRLSIGIM